MDVKHSQVALPDPDYLARIGEIAYTVSSMEWKLLGDIDRLADALPVELTLGKLDPCTTGGIEHALRDCLAGQKIEDGPVKDYLEAARQALKVAFPIRNAVLHARPATDPEGRQRLYRTEYVNERGSDGKKGHKRLEARFFIDGDWFDDSLRKLNEQIAKLNAVRPPLR